MMLLPHTSLCVCFFVCLSVCAFQPSANHPSPAHLITSSILTPSPHPKRPLLGKAEYVSLPHHALCVCVCVCVCQGLKGRKKRTTWPARDNPD
ncbi:hypothetical protein B0T24DRAFT_326936 [Lasiosphaeria ovina]|uniref:Secreted protein n=1 Tax=Lasiosphaeria ovina TaxID=92902 RepID=A0AAE0N621_9PEZI|nr:hypothetical protein B0T24DRAFT_326936 [Lasiosphaeria ovina]